MKILIIATNIGRTAPGIVFERLIKGLAATHEVDVLTSDFDPSVDLSNVKNTIISKKLVLHWRVMKTLIGVFSINPVDIYWAWRSIKSVTKKDKQGYDLVFSFLSFHHYGALIAGAKYALQNNFKFAVYSVDAVPAPPGWPENKGYYKGVKKLIARYLSQADAFFSANEKMLSYQLSTFNPSKNLISGVIYNPGFEGNKLFPDASGGSNYFLYTGGIYGARKANYLLEGFQKLLRSHPNSNLVFVGTRLSPSDLSILNTTTVSKIQIYPFTKDLTPYYSIATSLIDIDADIDNDVFLSSKIVNYLLINRIIISETGTNSPSRNLFGGINSIIQCNHDADEIYRAMENSIKMKNSITFEDRQTVSSLFTLKNIVNDLNEKLEALKYLNQ